MATDVTIGGSGALFVGEDKILRFECYSVNTGLPIDMLPFQAQMVFDVRLKDASIDPAILSLTSFTVSGTYSGVSRAANEQRAYLVLTDDQMNLFRQKTPPYRWSWKRTSAGSETVISRGDFAPEKATAP